MSSMSRRARRLFSAAKAAAVGTAEGAATVLDTAQVVWPTADRFEVTRSLRPGPDARDYALIPRAAAPRWLLPIDSPAAAGAIVGQDTGARRAVVRGLVLAHRSRVAERLPLRRLRIVGGHQASLVTMLEDTVARAVGPTAGPLHVALRLGSWGHARSLVVRVLGPTGSTIAFGKVGIDAHGHAAVRAEGRNLTHVASLGLRRVATSDVLARHEWRGLDVLVVSPLLAGEPPADAGLPVEAMLELASSATPRSAPLTDSGWWSTVLDRLAQVDDPGLRSELDARAREIGAAAPATPVPLGPWHGDWTAWNMAWDGPRVLLWDWEHFAEDVPVGFDLVHHLAQGLRVSAGTGPEAEAAWRVMADAVLARHVDLDRTARDLVRAAYLLEVNLRFVLDRQGSLDESTPRAWWGLGLLRRETGRLTAP